MAGRPPHVPTPETRELAESLAGYGVPYEQIGALIADGIDRDTLTKHYREDLERGKAKANSKVGKTLFQKAIDGDTAAMIWWSKSQMRWKGTDALEHSGPDGGAIQQEITARLTPEEAYLKMIGK